jgi:hypothetical protein
MITFLNGISGRSYEYLLELSLRRGKILFFIWFLGFGRGSGREFGGGRSEVLGVMRI